MSPRLLQRMRVVGLLAPGAAVGGMDAAAREAVHFTGHERAIVPIPAGHPAR